MTPANCDRFLTPEQASRVYDRIGRVQDWQAFYEGPAVRDLIQYADFASSKSIYEFGCGTGAFAVELLRNHLPYDSRYVGVDISPRMIELATTHLRYWRDRALVQLTNGSGKLDVPDHTVDRFVSNYVFDLLEPQYAASVLREGHRMLANVGRLCLISLTKGTSGLSRTVTAAWSRLWKLNPMLTGGCRPLALGTLLDPEHWCIEHRAKIISFGIPSEVLIASPRIP